CVNTCDPDQICLDPARTIFAGGPGSFACLQFDGDPFSCSAAWHVGGDLTASSCFYHEGLCDGCGPNNQNAGLCVDFCEAGAPTCADPTRTVFAGGGPGSGACTQFDGDQVACEAAWHLAGQTGEPSACFYDQGFCSGCGPNNEGDGVCANTCNPDHLCLDSLRTIFAGGPLSGACTQFNGDAASCELAWHIGGDDTASSCFYDAGICRGCGPNNANSGLCVDTCEISPCGNGRLDPGEACDDGNTDDQDGCSSACEIETSFVCAGEPSFCGRVGAQSQSRERCINALNKSFAKVTKAKGGVVCGCLKSASKGKLGTVSIEACLLGDPKGKVAKAVAKTLAKESKRCPLPPDFGPIDPNTVNAAALEKELDLLHDVFGSDVNGVIVVDPLNSPTAKCQLAAMKAAKKCQDAKLKAFNRCKKNGLKDRSLRSFLDLQNSCLGLGSAGIPDDGGKIAKACSTKLLIAVTKKCGGSIDLSTAFPGCPPGDAAALAACLDRKVECQVCRALNRVDRLVRDCDEFDDGVTNGSCP
ncbi:MAG: hypothetical protein ACE5FG_10940, partial [Myxococcota bacterium]